MCLDLHMFYTWQWSGALVKFQRWRTSISQQVQLWAILSQVVGTVFQKMWDRPQLWQCLNPGWKQFYLAVHMTTESIVSALFTFKLINDYFLYLWNDFICLLLILCSCKALWIALCTNCALQINLPCLALLQKSSLDIFKCRWPGHNISLSKRWKLDGTVPLPCCKGSMT